jgi:hypothetical protein
MSRSEDDLVPRGGGAFLAEVAARRCLCRSSGGAVNGVHGANHVGTERMNELATRPSPAAERMRAHRQRRRDGLRCLTIELRETEIDALIRKGLLKPGTRNNPTALREALYAVLDGTLGAAP